MAKYQAQDMEKIKNHYSRPEVIKAIMDSSFDKEVVSSYGGTGYGRRPDVIIYADDIKSLVKQGATSFHASEELWNDPLAIKTGMSKKEQSQIRKGWDLVLDIDCDYLPFSQIAGDLLVKELVAYGIEHVSVKFSGNHGFHIAVPFECFPQTINNTPLRTLFPEAPRAIADFLSYRIRNLLRDELVNSVIPGQDPFKVDKAVKQISDLASVPVETLLQTEGELTTLNPFKVVAIDTILITSRHLYRQVYSINEKSGLVSIPINPTKILQFKKEIASMDNNIFSKFTFLDRTGASASEGSDLLRDSLDFVSARDRVIEEEKLKRRESDFSIAIGEKIPEEFFPPHIKALLGPLPDGKKRAMFILGNFLRCVGYTDNEVEERLEMWNKLQEEPLRESFFKGHMSHFRKNQKPMLPYNFKDTVYKDIIDVQLDPIAKNLVDKSKNPVAYAKIRFEQYKDAKEKEKPKPKPKPKPKKEKPSEKSDTTTKSSSKEEENSAKMEPESRSQSTTMEHEQKEDDNKNEPK